MNFQKSTEKGLLLPRRTASQRDVINSPVAGLVIWCNNCGDVGELQIYNGTGWTNAIGDHPNFSNCEDLLIYEGQGYATIQLGTQFWMA